MNPSLSLSKDTWQKVKFSDIAEEVKEVIDKPSKSGLDRFVGGDHLDSGDLHIKRWGSTNDVNAQKLLFKKGHILFGKRNAYLRKVAFADFDGVCSAHMMVLKPRTENIEESFFPHFMQTDQFWDRALMISEGSMSPTIKWKILAEQEFLIPPKEQQRRIATTLWAAEDCIVKGERFVVAAERAKQILMRELFSKGIGHREFQEVNGFGKLPKIWDIKTIKELFETKLGKMLSPISKTGKNPKPYLRNVNVQWGWIDVSDLLEMDFSKGECERFCLIPGDILVCEGGEIGRTAIWHGELQECYYQKAIHRLRPLENKIVPEFFAYHMMYAFLIGKKYSDVGTVTTIAHLTEEKFEVLRIPVPPLAEQRQITTILTRCDETIAAARANVGAAKALKMKMINEMLGPENPRRNTDRDL